ncbi:hypothetical protein PJ985_10990 [Streptomyces sp. ACA25]|uniref:hypothetical protein n=1 Tax=Streptomyces sp. ACA25 TaxID=3022596 RepID=UPI002306E3D0|nr:hypothetical protein [Streptomyces sp. ACA25]MDB1088091.1 hypothetical protein [Streptomyces sp. ACA25]
MGIRGEQLVLDYLSKVGDLAHTTSMSSAERNALVGQLREEIGRQRASLSREERDADVKRILKNMGRPEEVVAAAGGGADTPAPPVPRPVTGSRPADGARPETPDGPTGGGPGPGTDADRMAAAGARADMLLSEEEAERPRYAPPPVQIWQDGQIGGFRGGIEIPEMLRPPTHPEKPAPRPPGPLDDLDTEKDPEDADAPGAVPGSKGRKRLWRRIRKRPKGGKHVGGPIELLAALLLVAGTVLGSLLVLAGGWLLAFWSPRLSRREAQWGTFGMPALVVGGYVTWILGRMNDYWGEPIEAENALADALVDQYPLLLRLAALASALFLFWRARRPAP